MKRISVINMEIAVWFLHENYNEIIDRDVREFVRRETLIIQ